MKVNMTPNPLDVVTIHASQGDTEARQWEFELHNNGELIDTSEITEQLFFKAYKGGTEQILPENTSTPTTSPFKGDIKYPQGLLTDQEFLYRQSPTEEDGLAWIKNIKGNTLVWNQLVQNGNFADTSGWSGTRVTLSASSNILTATVSQASTGKGQRVYKNLGINDTHTKLYTCEIKATSGVKICLGSNTADATGYTILASATANGNWQKLSAISSLNHAYIMVGLEANTSVGDSYQIRNVQVFDLTQMGLDSITSVDEFTSLFSLPYYDYNTGSLLSFNGTGLKTTGKNKILFANGTRTGTGITGTVSAGVFSATGTATSAYANLNYFNTIDFIENGKQYTVGLNAPIGYSIVFRFATDTTDTTYQQVTVSANSQFTTFTANNDFKYVRLYISSLASGTVVNISNMIPIIANGQIDTFEPYHTETTTLPISTYFPTGMKSAGTVYDELTPSKAITKLKEVTFSSVSAFDSSGKLGLLGDVTDAVNITRGDEVPNDKSVFETYSLSNLRTNDVNGITQFGKTLFVRLQGKTTLAEYNTYLSANPLTIIYELATPTETSFTTASLVTENGETPLSNEDGVLIGKCTEQLSENPGFIDAKIKLSDSDGECYSNKIQLHVERSPQ